MNITKTKKNFRKLLEPLEKIVFSNYYFSFQSTLNYKSKLKILFKYIMLNFGFGNNLSQTEINFVLYSKACERMLVPIICNMLERIQSHSRPIKINLIILPGIYQLSLNSLNLKKLTNLNCNIETDYFSLIRACHRPNHSIAVFCLDHRTAYQYHRWGVDAVDTLRKFGVKTLSIQHGGTRVDSVESLSSSASDIILVWGQRVYRELVEKYKVNPNRLKIVGNPLHDHLKNYTKQKTVKALVNFFPCINYQLKSKQVILLATCLHYEYKGYEEENLMYVEYIKYIYQSIDFSRFLLLVKMHPHDTQLPNLYRENIPNDNASKESILIVNPNITELDVYSLVKVADLLITRSSTVAEEALLMGKKVIAFDLIPEGPSKNYRHLKDYGAYTVVYKSDINNLSEAIDKVACQNDESLTNTCKDIEGELTYRLDGNSTNRAANEILKQCMLTSTI